MKRSTRDKATQTLPDPLEEGSVNGHAISDRENAPEEAKENIHASGQTELQTGLPAPWLSIITAMLIL